MTTPGPPKRKSLQTDAGPFQHRKEGCRGHRREQPLFQLEDQDEMAGLFKLIMDSLENPGKVKGKKLKILGDISSGPWAR